MYNYRLPLKYTIANYNKGEPRNIPTILDPYLFSDLIKRQLALSNYDEIDVDLFIVFPSPILNSLETSSGGAQYNSTRNVKVSDVYFH